ncbi:hypothetical protein L0636_06525 [Halomonas janggokensis]|uniref:Uncharacterized protein n=1 Tax=Vreelandella janggokensis TaxID=370767 RepID=A0ABT4IV74_9GAMM|nr:hypothetical protein [Halomonas janggokensis]MCZ0927573.1 hypothetical protein [Halomonas janggokensis]MCZ0930081.1 hypothetical protein [Halomonas janggokensis]
MTNHLIAMPDSVIDVGSHLGHALRDDQQSLPGAFTLALGGLKQARVKAKGSQ